MLTINAQRLLDDLDALGKIGATSNGGVSRPAMSEADVQARQWFRQRCEDANLRVQQDGAGNLSATLACNEPNAQTMMIGSHLDSVPNGGRFDGALGVITALEVARTVQESAIKLPFHLEVMSFNDEEGTHIGLLGSRALTGDLTESDLKQTRSSIEAFHDGMQRLGISNESIVAAQRDLDSICAFVEIHIEQGTRLEDSDVPIGVVTSVVGIRSFWLTFTGQAAHAGTMPMHKRRDAFWGASSFAQSARIRVMDEFTPGVVNIGQVELSPGAFNIVPQEAKLALEFRHGDEVLLDQMQHVLLQLAAQIGQEYDLDVEAQPANQIVSAKMDETIVVHIEAAAQTLALPSKRLMSFAGHDTQSMSRHVPSAMFFVPSVDGISHHPAELTHSHDCVNAANVLLHTILKIAAQPV